MKKKLALFLTFILLFSQSVFPLDRAFSEYGNNQIFSSVDWLPYAVGEGNDPLDQNPNSTDIAGNSQLPAVSYSYDSTYLYFKMRLDANPLNNKNDNFDQYAWTVLFNTDGNEHDWEYMVSLNGLAETVQIGKNTEKELDSWGDQAEDWLWTGTAIDYADARPIDTSLSNFNNDQDFFAYWAVPWADFANVTGLTPTSMIQLFYATSANASNYNKDRMGGHPTSFADAWGEPILINGTTPNPPSIEITGGDTRITNDSTPLISGNSSAVDGSFVDVTLYLKSDPAYTFTYQTTVENGQWQTLVTSSLKNGEYNVTANVDEEGQYGIDEQTLIVDPSLIIAPEITITTPTDGSSVTDSTPTISGSYTSGTSSNNIVVEFINGNNTVVVTGTATLSNGTWDYTPSSNLPLGNYQVKATITDEVNQTANSIIEITIAKAKVLNIVIENNDPLLTNVNTPIFTGTSNALDGVTIFVTIDNTSYTTTVTNGSWSLQWPEELTDGNYIVKASVEEQGQSANDSINLIVDTIKPALSIDGGTEHTTNNSTPTISGTTDAPDNSIVTITVDGKDYNATVTNGTWSIVPNELADGVYEVTATIADEAGNSTTVKQVLTVDTTGPAISITSPENEAILKDQTPTVTGTVEAGSTVDVEFINGNNSVVHSGHATVTDDNWTYTPSENLPEGTYTVKAIGTDALGNKNNAIITITIDITAPAITIDGGTEHTTNNSTPTISGTTDAPDNSIVTITVDGKEYNATVTNGTWSIVPNELADGVYEVTATIADEAGNSATAEQLLTIDTLAPEVSIDSPLDNSILELGDIPISGTAEVGSTVTLFLDENEAVTLTTNELGEWTYNPTPALSKGVHDVTVTAEDAYGNVSEPVSITFEVVEKDITEQEDSNITINLSADPQSILGNGIDYTILTAKLTDDEGKPLENYEVQFSAPVGTFPNGFTVFTDQDGIATVKYVSAKTESDETLSYLVSAKAFNLDGNFVEQEQISITFNPAIVSGVVIDNETQQPVNNAKVVLSSDFDQDGSVDFTTTVYSDEDGKYVITIPKGNVNYLLEITKPILIGNRIQDVTFKQNVTAGSVSGTGTDEFFSSESATGIILMSDGSNGSLSLENYDNIIVEVEDENGNLISLNGSVDPNSGVFLVDGLEVNKVHTLKFYYVFEDGSKIQVSNLSVEISNNGELNISSCLIDPYGTITNKETGEVIEGAVVELYYADTIRNQEAGRVKDTLVELPILVFPPNDNHNPQNSSADGKYAYMVYPEADYYILVKKNGFELYESPTIEVNQEIVKHDIELTPIPQELPATATSNANYLLTGIALLFIGLVSLFLYRRTPKNS